MTDVDKTHFIVLVLLLKAASKLFFRKTINRINPIIEPTSAISCIPIKNGT